MYKVTSYEVHLQIMKNRGAMLWKHSFVTRDNRNYNPSNTQFWSFSYNFIFFLLRGAYLSYVQIKTLFCILKNKRKLSHLAISNDVTVFQPIRNKQLPNARQVSSSMRDFIVLVFNLKFFI